MSQPIHPPPDTRALQLAAARGVIAAAMRQGRRTPAELAEAQLYAGVLFDPTTAQALVEVGREQAHAEACASHTAQIEELRQAVTVLRLRVAALTSVDELAAADGASCYICGCTEDRPCVGGCHWVPAPRMRDLCSACAAVIPGSPAELATQTAADEWVTCVNPRGCPRRERAARAAVMGWENGLCPQCAAHAADRADFLAAERGERP